MSHVVAIDEQITDLNAMERACQTLGLALAFGQKTFKWWGHSVGDYALPKGFTEEDLGYCEHAIKLLNNKDAYEIGLCTRRDGVPGYTMVWDFYGGGKGLQAVVGDECCNLIQAYKKEVTLSTLQGFACNEIPMENGDIVLEMTR